MRKFISYQAILQKYDEEALSIAPDGNKFTGYELLKNRPFLFEEVNGWRVMIVPLLQETITFAVSLEKEGTTERLGMLTQHKEVELEL